MIDRDEWKEKNQICLFITKLIKSSTSYMYLYAQKWGYEFVN